MLSEIMKKCDFLTLLELDVYLVKKKLEELVYKKLENLYYSLRSDV